MGIFSRLISVKQEPEKQAEPIILFQQGFTQSKSFRGHKRFHVTYYGFKPAEEGLEQFRKANVDLSKADILLRRMERSDYIFLDVIIDGFFIGSVSELSCNDTQKEFLENELYKGHVDSAHVRIEYETIFFTNKKGKTESIEREKIYLFLKAMD